MKNPRIGTRFAKEFRTLLRQNGHKPGPITFSVTVENEETGYNNRVYFSDCTRCMLTAELLTEPKVHGGPRSGSSFLFMRPRKGRTLDIGQCDSQRSARPYLNRS